MSKTLLITGAGVDRTQGIDFPLAATLLPEIVAFSNGSGKEIEAKLRKIIPGLQFRFTKLITKAIETISTREWSEQRPMIERLSSVVNSLSEDELKMKQHGELLIRLFNKLATVAKDAEIDSEIEELIKSVFADKADDYLGSDSILDISKMSLSETFKSVLKETLKMSLTNENHKIANALGVEMLNIENLLIEKFLGFYNNKQSEIKNYVYISWMLWAYLVHKEKIVLAEHSVDSLPFYSSIPKDWKALTLNYTSFLEKTLSKENVVYFHGGLSEYVRMDRRELSDIDSFADIDIIKFLDDNVKENVRFDENPSDSKHVIPALVPPMKLKPVLSSNYIEKWHNASEWVKNAEIIVVVGYSFNEADEHFNDIIRQNFANKKVHIIAPDVTSEGCLRNFQKIFSVPVDEWTSGKKNNGVEYKRHNSITLYSTYADEIDFTWFK